MILPPDELLKELKESSEVLPGREANLILSIFFSSVSFQMSLGLRMLRRSRRSQQRTPSLTRNQEWRRRRRKQEKREERRSRSQVKR
jgi:hypothetical protein